MSFNNTSHLPLGLSNNSSNTSVNHSGVNVDISQDQSASPRSTNLLPSTPSSSNLKDRSINLSLENILIRYHNDVGPVLADLLSFRDLIYLSWACKSFYAVNFIGKITTKELIAEKYSEMLDNDFVILDARGTPEEFLKDNPLVNKRMSALKSFWRSRVGSNELANQFLVEQIGENASASMNNYNNEDAQCLWIDLLSTEKSTCIRDKFSICSPKLVFLSKNKEYFSIAHVIISKIDVLLKILNQQEIVISNDLRPKL